MSKEKIIVCGSVAYDSIFKFNGLIKESFVKDKLDIVNLSFLTDSMKRLRGGCALNISYNLSLLGFEPMIFGSVGKDFKEWKWLRSRKIKSLLHTTDDFTASSFSLFDNENNQITNFYPGAMRNDSSLSLQNLKENADMVVISPTMPEAMSNFVSDCQKLCVPYLYDPGMQLPILKATDISTGVLNSKISVFNEYEYFLMLEKTKLCTDDLKDVIIIKTMAEKGAEIFYKGQKVSVESVKVDVLDPVGAGDAFRAGVIRAFFEGKDLETMARYGTIIASASLSSEGGSYHRISLSQFNKKMKEMNK